MAIWDSIQTKEELENFIYKTITQILTKEDKTTMRCEVKLYEKLIMELAGWSYGKDVIFKNEEDNTWYNRDTCENQTTEEMIEWAKGRIGRYLSDDISFPRWFKCPNCNAIIDFNSEVESLFELDDEGDDYLEEDELKKNGNADFDPRKGVILHTIFCHRCNASWAMSIGEIDLSTVDESWKNNI